MFPYLALMTALTGVGIGLLVSVVDRRDFHSAEDGVWWAIVTLASVGYGDIVPTTSWGRLLGGIVIISASPSSPSSRRR